MPVVQRSTRRKFDSFCTHRVYFYLFFFARLDLFVLAMGAILGIEEIEH